MFTRTRSETKTGLLRDPYCETLSAAHRRRPAQGSRGSLTTRIGHTQVLPGSGKAGVLKGLVAHGNHTLLFAVAGFGHKVDGLIVQAL